MNKLILLFCLAFITLTSCSSDENFSNVDPTSTIKPTKIVTTSVSSDTFVSTSTYTYIGNKIVEELIDSKFEYSKIKYTYSGDDIVKIEKFMMEDGVTFFLYRTTTYSYIAGKIKFETIKLENESKYYKLIFIHNDDGTITTTASEINSATGIETQSTSIVKKYFSNGNLTKIEIRGTDGIIYRSENYAYDLSKFNVFKNVTGFNKINLGGNNNLLSITYSGTPATILNYNSTYNTSNYPTQVENTRYSTTAPLTQTQKITY